MISIESLEIRPTFEVGQTSRFFELEEKDRDPTAFVLLTNSCINIESEDPVSIETLKTVENNETRNGELMKQGKGLW